MVEKRWQQELPEIVAHTAYYAMYHAAIALLAKRELSKPKTHSGLSARFSEYFRDVEPDGREQVRRLGRALERVLLQTMTPSTLSASMMPELPATRQCYS